MLRDLPAMTGRDYDLIVIGGGATGASIAWDASLRGLSVALLEKDDFAHGTTAGSSKLIHGGLRYLQNGEVRLVREALAERRIWCVVAPHMVDPMPFLLPTHGWGSSSRFLLSLGMVVYDILSFDRNRLQDDDKKLPRSRGLSRREAVRLAPVLGRHECGGAKLFYDCQMHAPERLCMESILAAGQFGADAANYARVTGLDCVRDGGEVRVTGVQVRDELTGAGHRLRGRVTINASGPWADSTMALLGNDQPARTLMHSKGIHLIVRELCTDYALVSKTDSGHHFFLLPWRGHTILGTTDEIFKEAPDRLCVTEADIDAFLGIVNAGLPGLCLTREDVLHAYAGLRPLVDEQAGVQGSRRDSYKASRVSEVVDHRETDRLRGLMSTIGGKWTTSRALAQRAVDQVLIKLGRDPLPSQTHCTPLYGGEIGRLRSFIARACKRRSQFGPDLVTNLCRYYGARYEDVLAAGDDAAQRLADGRPEIAGQVRYAVRYEMARRLDDVVMRRTGIGTLGHPGAPMLERCARIMQEELGWNEARMQQELLDVMRCFPLGPRA